MPNILIPMAGEGRRFAEKGYTFPKPLIPIKNKPMIEHVVNSLNMDGRYIFLVQKSHLEKYSLDLMLKQIAGKDCVVIPVDGITEGAACTCLLAKEYINDDDELIIANSDQIIEYSKENFDILRDWSCADGIIFSFYATHPKWSFAKLNLENKVSEVAEKKPISNIATTGIYYYRYGMEFVESAEDMIRKNVRTNNEFYVCPVYNEMILREKVILPFFVDKMFPTGTPEDLEEYTKGL